MSNVAALMKGRALEAGDGIYLERADRREPIIEEYLRALVARVPLLKPQLGQLRAFAANVNALEAEMRTLDAAALANALNTASFTMRRQGFTDELVARAFAAIREASSRTLGMRHHDVQLMGGWVLLHGRIAEMETGEGKTLVATLAACAAAAAGAAVHVITVNDYLAERDSQTNGPLFGFFGLTVGLVKQGMSPAERREQYGRDVVYVSNKEIVFDYLKDRIATGSASAAHYRVRRLYRGGRGPEVLLRGLHVAIVDEADSVLIDEARTPLIISETRPDEHGPALYQKALEIAAQLERGKHYELTAHRDIWITAEGQRHLRGLAEGLTGVWTSSLWRNELVEKALSARCCFERDQHYIVADGKVQIVDESTGRVMPDRSWEHGLHQMIEAKEGCEITGPRSTLSRITYQRFFRRYLLLCGMTGTAAEVEPELRRVYDLEVITIPTHRPSRRHRLANRVWPSATERWAAVVDRALELSRDGRAVLVGTRSVEASELLGTLLSTRGISHTVLNARQDREEADIVAEAGQPGRITVATNMAGRGTDIKIAPEVSDQGGLHVILTEFHESARVDRQLFGRCARQGQPGSVEALVSLDDEVFKRFAPLLWSLAKAVAARRGTVPPWLLHLLVKTAQALAERHGVRTRLATLKQDKKLQAALGFSGRPT
jgi:preprotein translocase subunit SecA